VPSLAIPCAPTGHESKLVIGPFALSGSVLWTWSHHHYVARSVPGKSGVVVGSEVWWPVLLAAPDQVWWSTSAPYRLYREQQPVPVEIEGPLGQRPLAGDLAFGVLFDDALDVRVVRDGVIGSNVVAKLPAAPTFAPVDDPPPFAALDGNVVFWTSGAAVHATSLETGKTDVVASAPATAVAAGEGIVAWMVGAQTFARAAGDAAAPPSVLGTAGSGRAIALHRGRVVVAGSSGLEGFDPVTGSGGVFARDVGPVASLATVNDDLFALGTDGRLWRCR
jgi:hypothetical protein